MLALLSPLLQGPGSAADPGRQASQYLTMAKDLAVEHGPNLLGALVILLAGRWAARGLARLLEKVLLSRELDPTLVGFLASVLRMALLAFVVVAAIQRLGVDTTSFAAMVAAAGLAVGFALQGSLANFASGVMIIVFKPFKVGDFVEAAGVAGVAEQILMFNTYLRTGDNKQVIVPNASLTAGNITNYSAKKTRRVDMVVGIGYEDDIRKAKEVLEGILARDERILKDPAPVVAVSELADSSVNLVVRPWVRTADYWNVLWSLTERVKLAFDEQGISIPYPQRDLHLFQERAA